MLINDFNGMVCSSIDQAISDALSIRVMESLYVYLRQNHKMTREEVPSHLDMFFSAMELVFGVMGARTLGRIAARNLYARLNLKFDNRDGLTLSDYVDEAKDKMQAGP